MEPLLAFAEELERRDAGVADALAAVERLQCEVEDVRTRATATSAFLAALPAALAERAGDERAAIEARERAEAAVREAADLLARTKKDQQRVQLERELADAEADLHSAEFWVAQAREARAAAERDGAAQRAKADELAERAAELAPRVRDVAPPSGSGLPAVVDWAARARGALLLERSGLAREREEVVREASELLASVSGDPQTAVAVAGVRERVARAIGTS
jgi:septal ring factor EnvC (AmiA/AmiB activator)